MTVFLDDHGARSVFRGLVLSVVALAACVTAAQEGPQTPHSALPEWWVAHVDFMTRHGGTWVAPNPANDSDPQQPDAYVMEWRAAHGGHVLIGRLYGVENGEEIAEYWTYREFWHPGERRAIIEQWGGGGTYGVGSSSWEDDRGVLDQTFWLPDGRHWREGHRNEERGDTYVTRSFDIDANGSWIDSSTFTWRRQIEQAH
jgi:hypothetical protein